MGEGESAEEITASISRSVRGFSFELIVAAFVHRGTGYRFAVYSPRGLFVQMKSLLQFGLCQFPDDSETDIGHSLDPFFYTGPNARIASVRCEFVALPSEPRDRWSWRIQGCSTFYEIFLKQ